MNNITEQIKKDSVLTAIMPYLKNKEAYLVGGYVRDLFLGKTSYDRDIILINEDIQGLAKQISQAINATFIELDKDWGIYRLVLQDKKNYIDLAKALENDLEKDLKRRDITINSIAYNLNSNEFYDPNNGITDLETKTIKGIDEQNFINDPLRLLRVFRFASTLNFKIEQNTLNQIYKYVSLISQPAKERVNVEILKLFEGTNVAQTLINMDKLGMLEMLFPFTAELKTIPPNAHHHLDLFNHSIETVKQIDLLLPTFDEKVKSIMTEQPYGNVKKSAFLKLAAFMHDIGKPSTWTIDETTGRHRFILHDSLGAEIATQYLKNLKFSKKQIIHIQTLIKNHIYPSNVNVNNEKSIMKFLRKMESLTCDVIVLAMADRLSALGPEISQKIVDDNIKQLNTLLNKYFEQLEKLKPLPKLLSGNDIMSLLKIQAGPELGKIISTLKEAQEEGEITTKEEAIEFILLNFQ